MDIRAIDPMYCGCTECITGQYHSLDRASRDEVLAMLKGEIGNNTEVDITVNFATDQSSYFADSRDADVIVKIGDRSFDFNSDELNLGNLCVDCVITVRMTNGVLSMV